jgi:hypothetical protein
MFGQPAYEDNSGNNKGNMEWELEDNDGDVFYLNDWNTGRPLDENAPVYWHIRATSDYYAQKALNFLTDKEEERLEDLSTRLSDSDLKRTVTLGQILECWDNAYGEDLSEEYSGFVQNLLDVSKG